MRNWNTSLIYRLLSRHQNNIIVCIYVYWFVSKKPHNRLRKLSKSTLCGFILQKLHFSFRPQSSVLIDRMLSWLGQQIPEFGNRVLVLWYVRLLSLQYGTGYTCLNSASSRKAIFGLLWQHSKENTILLIISLLCAGLSRASLLSQSS